MLDKTADVKYTKELQRKTDNLNSRVVSRTEKKGQLKQCLRQISSVYSVLATAKPIPGFPYHMLTGRCDFVIDFTGLHAVLRAVPPESTGRRVYLMKNGKSFRYTESELKAETLP